MYGRSVVKKKRVRATWNCGEWRAIPARMRGRQGRSLLVRVRQAVYVIGLASKAVAKLADKRL